MAQPAENLTMNPEVVGFEYHLGLGHMQSERNYPISVSVERATLIPHSLSHNTMHCTNAEDIDDSTCILLLNYG